MSPDKHPEEIKSKELGIDNGGEAEDAENLETQIEAEKVKLEENLSELSDNLDEIDGLPPSRKEKILAYISEHQMAAFFALFFAANAGRYAFEGNWEEALFKLGVGAAFTAVAAKLESHGKKIRGGKEDENK